MKNVSLRDGGWWGEKSRLWSERAVAIGLMDTRHKRAKEREPLIYSQRDGLTSPRVAEAKTLTMAVLAFPVEQPSVGCVSVA